MSKNSILECIQKSKGYDIALFTTFNFEIAFFERFIKNALFSNRIKKISVFVDSQELNKSINKEKDVHNIGHHYVVNPIEIQGAFHPKIVLLLGKKKARVFVSSCNLTTSGYTINNEAYYSYDIDENNTQNVNLILGAIDFFAQLNDMSFHADDFLFKDILALRHIYEQYSSGETGPELIHNINMPILNALETRLEAVEHIDIAVPYYDNACLGLAGLSNLYPSSSITIYLQNNKARIPITKAEAIEKVTAFPFSGFGDRKNNYFYHGKVFRFSNSLGAVLMFGSANCTASALEKTYANGGNIEAVVLQRTTNEESIEFFDNFNACDDEEINYDLLKYETTDCSNFFFRYGILDSELHLYLGFNSLPENIKVHFDKEECIFTVLRDSLDVCLEVDSLAYKNTINLEIEYDKKIERVICWYTNPSAVQYTRNPSMPKFELEDVILDPKSSRYIPDQIKISNALALNVDEYLSDIHTQRMLLREKNIMTDDEEEFDDGVIDYVIPEDADYIYHSKMLKKLNSIKQSYYDSFFRFFHEDREKRSEPRGNAKKPEDGERKKRKPTTDEKKFKRFINKRIKGFIDQELVDVVSFDHYIACSSMFLSIFDKYSVMEHVIGLFDDEITAMYRLAIAENLIVLAGNDSEKRSQVLYLLVKILLTNRFYIEADWKSAYSIAEKTRELISRLDPSETLSFREKMERTIEVASDSDVVCDVRQAKAYLDELYGYIPLNRINDIMAREFSDEIKWGVDASDKNVAKTVVVTSRIVKYINYTDSQTIKALRDYNKQKKRWNRIVLEARLSPEFIDRKAPDPLVNVIREYDFTRNICRVIMKRKSGKCDQEKRIQLL